MGEFTNKYLDGEGLRYVWEQILSRLSEANISVLNTLDGGIEIAKLLQSQSGTGVSIYTPANLSEYNNDEGFIDDPGVNSVNGNKGDLNGIGDEAMTNIYIENLLS